MASSSSPSHPYSSLSLMNPRNNKYDVFLSFSRADTRDSFTSHLHSALCQKSIETFIDDQLIRGDDISESLLDTIASSSISIIIFSERYASSGWCLGELLKILECKHNYGQIVIPVFYRVDPLHVRKQVGIFGDSFLELEERFPEKMQRWRSALTEAANLSGFDSHVFRNESELIKKVVNDILEKLPKELSCDKNNHLPEVLSCNNKNHLLGVESKVGEMESLLAAAPLVGIWGMGGIGKTTIARAVFNKISRNFEGSCFLQNVREESQSPGGLARLQQKLLSEVLRDENAIPDIEFNFTRLSRRKALIVLDDVTCFRQIKFLIRSLDWFMPESRIIITTRDQKVLKNGGVKEKDIYEMKALECGHALELFSRHAFKENLPNEVGYQELSEKIINYAQGVPLALEILGCFLYGKGKEVWENAINELKRILNMEIQKVLKISFDGLDDEQKNIFLDIACFFKGEDKEFVIKFLDACGFAAQIGISDLVDKSLIIIHGNSITVHDLLQEMGREIVRQESVNNPGERSRLWHHEDIIEVLTSNTHHGKFNRMVIAASNSFTKTPNPSLIPRLNKLVSLNLIGCSKLKRLPVEISSVVNVEEVRLNGTAIEKLPSSIGSLSGLLDLDLQNCKRLKSLPSSLCKLKSLRSLYLNGCSNLQRLPQELGNLEALEFLSAIATAIREVPSSIVRLNNVRDINFSRSKGHKQMGLSLPITISLDGLYNLTYLDLSDCCITKLPENIGQLSSLEYLYLSKNNFERIPKSIIQLSKLSCLYLSYCGKLQSLPKLPCSLHKLYAHHCMALESLSGLFPKSYESCPPCFELNGNYNLDRNVVGGILEDALQNIQHVATARWEHMHAQEKKSYPEFEGFAILPGNEIPKWFSFQSMGSLIKLKTPPAGWFNNKNVIGFAFGAIVSFRDHYDDVFELFCDIKVKPKDCDPHVIQIYLELYCYVESDHLILGYYLFGNDDLNGFRDCVIEAVQFYFKKDHDDSERLECCGLKRCGIHLLYAPDSTEDPSGSFNNEEEEELQPQQMTEIILNRHPSHAAGGAANVSQPANVDDSRA
ncbi:disease resistance protein RUN1-like isoform X4 [Citrus sinensis]|uniref:disease resistance protein RUN1-like isoform X4 n=1 Tax=Citrus sinensis TaxID=2711 RepID=UPI002277C41B|nr:disease resistance protein RUN1-like isoform X4 [Citrus sinensis]